MIFLVTESPSHRVTECRDVSTTPIKINNMLLLRLIFESTVRVQVKIYI